MWFRSWRSTIRACSSDFKVVLEEWRPERSSFLDAQNPIRCCSGEKYLKKRKGHLPSTERPWPVWGIESSSLCENIVWVKGITGAESGKVSRGQITVGATVRIRFVVLCGKRNIMQSTKQNTVVRFGLWTHVTMATRQRMDWRQANQLGNLQSPRQETEVYPVGAMRIRRIRWNKENFGVS